MLTRHLLTVLPPVLVLTFAATASADDPTPDATPITCRLSATSPQSAGGPIEVDLTLVNTRQQDLEILAWGTPFEGWLSKSLVVEKDGEALPYGGPMVKRGDPDAEEYILLPAGDEISATADLSQVYLLEPGTYTVTFPGRIHDLVAAGEPIPRGGDARTPIRVDCASIELVVE